MDCREFRSLFSSYLDAELDNGRKGRAEKHLSGCRSCARLVQAHRSGVNALVANAASLTPPADLFERVMVAVGRPEPRASVIRFSRGLRPRVLVPVMSAAVLLLSLGLFMNNDSGPRPAYQGLAVVDSTMDMINYQVAEQLASKENSQRMKAVRLASYARTEEETVLRSGVSRNPVLILSGVDENAE